MIKVIVVGAKGKMGFSKTDCEEERFAFVLLDEIDTQVRLEIGAVLTRLGLQVGPTQHPISPRKVGTTDHRRELVALPVRLELPSIAEMPLPNVPGCVTGRPQRLGHRDNVERQRHGGGRRDDALERAPVARDVSGDSDPRLVLSGLHGTACR